MSIETTIRSALRDGAGQLDLHGEGPEHARARAGQRARRRRATGAGLTALVVLGGGAFVASRVGGTSVDFAEPAVGSGEPAALIWREEAGVLGATQDVVVTADGAYYALSTAPGTTWEDSGPDGWVPQSLYRSTDGVTWTDVAVDGAERIAALDARGSVLYALSTSPATNGGTGRAAVSTDGGATWQRADLPSTVTAPPATVPLWGPGVNADLAVGEDLLLASVHSRWDVDQSAVLTSEEAANGDWTAADRRRSGRLRQPLPGAAASRADGRRQRCPAPSDACASRRRRPPAWCPGPTSAWRASRPSTSTSSSPRPTASPGSASTRSFGTDWLQELAAIPGGFVAITDGFDPATETSTLRVHRSTDGTDWQVVATAEDQWFDYEVLGTRLLAAGSDGTTLTVATSDDGGATWASQDLRALADPEGRYAELWTANFDAGPLGAALMVNGTSATGDAVELRAAHQLRRHHLDRDPAGRHRRGRRRVRQPSSGWRSAPTASRSA